MDKGKRERECMKKMVRYLFQNFNYADRQKMERKRERMREREREREKERQKERKTCVRVSVSVPGVYKRDACDYMDEGKRESERESVCKENGWIFFFLKRRRSR